MKAELLIYDLDGTLLNSGPVVAGILNEIRNVLGLIELPIEYYYPWLSVGGEELIKHALEINQGDLAYYLNFFREKYQQDRYLSSQEIYPGVVDTLSTLREMGVATAICTNKPRGQVDKILEHFDLGKYFELVVAAGDLPVKKPNVMCAYECLNFFGVPADSSIYVGDSRVDQMLSNLAGIRFIKFLGGYDDGVSKEQCFGQIDSHVDIFRYLECLS